MRHQFTSNSLTNEINSTFSKINSNKSPQRCQVGDATRSKSWTATFIWNMQMTCKWPVSERVENNETNSQMRTVGSGLCPGQTSEHFLEGSVSLERENQVKPVLPDGWTKRKKRGHCRWWLSANHIYTASTDGLSCKFFLLFFLREENSAKNGLTSHRSFILPSTCQSCRIFSLPVSMVIYSVSQRPERKFLLFFFLLKKRLNSSMVICCTSIGFDFIYAICSVLEVCSRWVMADKNKLSGRQMQQPDRPAVECLACVPHKP